MVLQADEVKHNVSDKLHQLQHRAESSSEDAQQKASETSAKVNLLSAVLAVRPPKEQCVFNMQYAAFFIFLPPS